jgi:hypothetical protein
VNEIIVSIAKKLALAIRLKKVSIMKVATEYLQHVKNGNPQIICECILHDAGALIPISKIFYSSKNKQHIDKKMDGWCLPNLELNACNRFLCTFII